jgi:hypothetical protein
VTPIGRFEARLPIVLYPLVTPVAGLFHLGLAAAVHPIWWGRPLLVVLVVGLGVTALITAILKDKHLAGLASWAFLVGLMADDLRALAMLWLLAATVIAIGLRFRSTRTDPWRRGPRVTSAMSAFAMALIAVVLLNGLQIGGVQSTVSEIAFDLATPRDPPATPRDSPDIYVMLLDAYPGEVAAAKEPRFDANLLISELESRGFDVARHSRSNYITTRVALPSLFWGRHLIDMSGLEPSSREHDARLLRIATDSGAALEELRLAGYERIAVVSGFSELGPIRVDRLIAPPQLNEMEWAILRSTGAGHILDAISPNYSAAQIRDRVLATFDEAAKLAEEPHDRKRFAFIHVPAPHSPWVTDAKGNLIFGPAALGAQEAPITDVQTRRRQFYGYASFIGGQAIATIDRIIAASDRPPVIVLFSDHGPDVEGDRFDPFASDLNERTSNLMAVLAPGHPDLFPDDATLVNLFPYVLNAYLGSDMPIQPNSIWAWKSNSSILDLVEVDHKTWRAKVRDEPLDD